MCLKRSYFIKDSWSTFYRCKSYLGRLRMLIIFTGVHIKFYSIPKLRSKVTFMNTPWASLSLKAYPSFHHLCSPHGLLAWVELSECQFAKMGEHLYNRLHWRSRAFWIVEESWTLLMGLIRLTRCSNRQKYSKRCAWISMINIWLRRHAYAFAISI